MKLRKNVENIVLKLWKYCPKNGTKTMKKFVEKIVENIVKKVTLLPIWKVQKNKNEFHV